MLPPLGTTLRIFRPYPHVYAFYDGRIAGQRAYSDQPNWLDDGAYALGICSYAIVDGDEALVYDTHVSLAHATLIRRRLEADGHSRIRVVLSHWHDDHVAGNAVFADCEIWAHALTERQLAAHREDMAQADPPIAPVILPSHLYEDKAALAVGRHVVTLRHADIHSLDGTVLLLAADRLLLAGDTLEDPITYVDEPERLAIHRQGLEMLEHLGVDRILPNHGAPEIIEAGGYRPGLIQATIAYLDRLTSSRTDATLARQALREFAAPAFETGAIRYFEPYERVHRHNLAAIAAVPISPESV